MAHDFNAFPELTTNQFRFYYLESPHKQITMDFEAKVVEVHDGDTVTLQWDERDFTFPLRLLDINAPELNREGGAESKSFLEDKLLGEDIRVEIDIKNRVGKFGRILGRIKTLGMDVGQESLRNGFSKRFGT